MNADYEEGRFDDEDSGSSAGPVAPLAGLSKREDFAGIETKQQAELASVSAAAMATATTNARYIVAERRPRDWGDVRVRLLSACKRPRFAEVAIYSKPTGTKPGRLTGNRNSVDGLSARFAEEALRCMGNLMAEEAVIYDDAQKRIVRLTLTDLESNLTYPRDITLEKTVERKFLKSGQTAIGSRTNSYGDKVYLVEATEDDLANKIGSMSSKVMRGLAIKLLPGDIKEECEDMIMSTRQAADKKDPDAARKRLVDSFFVMGVKPSDLAEYLGHPIEASSPTEIDGLRAIYAAISEGEATWQAVMGTKSPDAPKEATGVKDAIAKKAEEIKAKRTGRPAS